MALTKEQALAEFQKNELINVGALEIMIDKHLVKYAPNMTIKFVIPTWSTEKEIEIVKKRYENQQWKIEYQTDAEGRRFIFS
jgi:hypothetical protein